MERGTMMNIREIIECELAYSKCFCIFDENERLIRFSDKLLPDMYDHHYTYIKQYSSIQKLEELVKEEMSNRLFEGKDFCKILLDADFNASSFSINRHEASIGKYGYYQFDIANLHLMKKQDDCTVIKVENQSMLNDRLTLDKEFDEKTYGIDFCTRRVNRRGKVYLSNHGVDSYICYFNDTPVGSCDLFVHEGVAKIEDFAVSPFHQRKGYGTTILKALIKEALNQHAHTLYLITDEDDTAKEMYLKCGFHKIGEKTELFFSSIK